LFVIDLSARAALMRLYKIFFFLAGMIQI
jgi:hypothetical protein